MSNAAGGSSTNRIVVAIDGPAGAGKSTIARRVAAKLGAVYIDTGAMYRAVALRAMRSGTDLADAERLEEIARAADIRFETGTSRVRLDGEDVSEAIRKPEISPAASKISAIPGVRRMLVAKQREMGASGSVVMEGRDIGTVVFPGATVKIFLDADPQVRAVRRVRELEAKGSAPSVEEVAREIRERDLRDSTRADSPLVCAKDAVRVDTTPLSLEQVEQAILEIVRSKSPMHNVLVMKFGGTSVGSAERMQAVVRLSAEQQKKRPVAIVVSAMSKVTDLLLETMKRAEAGDQPGVDSNIEKLRLRHREACLALLPEDRHAAMLTAIDSIIAEFERISNGICLLGEAPLRSVDEAVAMGERLSTLLVAARLEADGTPAMAVNAAELIVTDADFGNATPLMDRTRDKARAKLLPLMEKGILPVITGFNGASIDGRPTTLGRGGSDFSASILAAALDATELWIWTDVDGIMTADPRIVPDCAVLEQVTYREAAELAYNGAKVLHPRTLAPLVDREIPVWSKNSFAPEKPGTKIVSKLPEVSRGARAVTSMANVALISIDPASAVLNGTLLMGRAIDALGRANIEVLIVSSSSYQQSFCFLVRTQELPAAVEALKAALALELEHGYLRPIDVDENVGLLAVVGEGMQGTPGQAGRIFTAISRENINIIAIAQGSSELTIAIVVHKDGLEKAVRAVHAESRMGELPAVRRAELEVR